jgi:hypothetical protein
MRGPGCPIVADPARGVQGRGDFGAPWLGGESGGESEALGTPADRRQVYHGPGNRSGPPRETLMDRHPWIETPRPSTKQRWLQFFRCRLALRLSPAYVWRRRQIPYGCPEVGGQMSSRGSVDGEICCRGTRFLLIPRRRCRRTGLSRGSPRCARPGRRSASHAQNNCIADCATLAGVAPAAADATPEHSKGPPSPPGGSGDQAPATRR